MKKIIILWLFFVVLSSVNAFSVNLSCPKEVISNQEFECNLLINDNSETYDVKLDFFGEEKRVSRIFNNEVWKSSNYYLISFINQEQEILRVIISNFSGNSSGILKLRKTGKTSVSYQENLSLIVKQEEIFKPVEQNLTVKSEEIKITKEEKYQESLIEKDKKIINKSAESIIKLNTDEKKEKVVYISKNEKIRENILIIFSVFLIIVIIFLVIKI
jgi:hypothetical protein